MRAISLLLAALLAASVFATLAPSATAKPYCTASEFGCDGIVCTYRPPACVGDPCWISCGSLAASAPEPTCWRVWSGPFSYADLCGDPSEGVKCLAYLEVTGMDGRERRCYLVGEGSATAAGPSAAGCHHLVHGHGFDTFLCWDVKGPLGCKAWSETRYSEGGTARRCIA